MSRQILTPILQGACVFRQDGREMVGVADGPGSGLQAGRPTVMRDCVGWIAGGRLPAGGQRAIVVGLDGPTAVGDGFWIARPDFEGSHLEPVLRFEDAAGTIVAADPGHEAGPRTPVTDATDACPACDAMAWVEAVTLPPQIVCARCGFALALGGWLAIAEHPGTRPDAATVAARRAAARARRGERQAEALASLRATLWWPDGDAAPFLSGWGGSGGRLERATLRDPAGRLTVEVDAAPHHLESRAAARDAFAEALREDHGRWPEASPAATRIWLAAREREAVAAAQAAPMRAAAVLVASVPCPARVVGDDHRWAAVVEPEGEERIVVCGRDRPPHGLALGRLDPGRLAPPPDL